jgi:S-adenosylmethionine:tRNA ribosyltransferase-isomerase
MGRIEHLDKADLVTLFEPGDLVVANDAATIPGRLIGRHEPTGRPIEIRLAGFDPGGHPTRFTAVVFGEGDHRTVTEERPPPPELSPGDRLRFSAFEAVIEHMLDHPRLVRVRFCTGHREFLAGLARHAHPIQYAHVPEPLALWDVWTVLAARPFAFEAPSAGFALDWRTISGWRRRGVALATLTHAAGVSSTGDPALDALLPFDEPYTIPAATGGSVARTRALGGRVIAVGTTVVRALESAAGPDGQVQSGSGLASGRIGPETRLRVVDTILTGMHAPGESHFELLGAFAPAATLQAVHSTAIDGRYRSHEFGDSLIIERVSAA